MLPKVDWVKPLICWAWRNAAFSCSVTWMMMVAVRRSSGRVGRLPWGVDRLWVVMVPSTWCWVRVRVDILCARGANLFET